MKQTILTVAFLITMSLAMRAQTSVQNNNAEQEVMMIVEQLKNAFMNSDVAFFEKYLASSYTLINPGGAVRNKVDMIDYTKAGNFKFESIIPDDRKITVYGNVAVVTQHNAEYQWMYILNKEGDDWKIVDMQGTRVMQGK